MRILFVISKYYPKVGGTPNCVRNIVKHISKEHNVEVLTTMDGVDDSATSSVDGVLVNKCISYAHIAIKDLIATDRPFRCVYFKSLIKKIFFRIVPIESLFLKWRYRKIIYRLNRSRNYDWVVAVGGDIVPCRAVLECKKLKRTCFYQLDPYTTNKTLSHHKEAMRSKLEKRIHNDFDLVVTTGMIKKEMEKFFEFGDNVLVCNFPNIENRVSLTTVHDQIRCVFCGAIYSARNVSKVLSIINKITEINKNIYFDFYIIGDSSEVEKAGKKNPNIAVFKPVSPDEIFDIMNEHQFLVNIGNLMKNQVPSKVYDYISTGLPILNFCCNTDCPTVNILKDYPLVFNVFPKDDELYISKKITKFLVDNAGCREEYSNIQMNYKENTIEYVADCIIDKMQQIGEGLC